MDQLTLSGMPSRTGTAADRRPRDTLFEAMVAVLGWDQRELTPTARGRINRALKGLRSVGATEVEILERGRRYKLKYPKAALTPNALEAHWAALAPKPQFVPWRMTDGEQRSLISKAHRRQMEAFGLTPEQAAHEVVANAAFDEDLVREVLAAHIKSR